MASMAMTEATPNRMPSEVRKARSLLCCSASTAVRNVKIAWGPSSARSRARVARSRRTGSILDGRLLTDRKSTRLNSSHSQISYAVFCLKKKKLEVEQYSQHLGPMPDFRHTSKEPDHRQT